MIVRVPGSSANVGPGFDVLGIAIGWRLEAGSADEPLPDRARWAEDSHPAAVAHRRAGGSGRLWIRSSIPVGRGLGFSGAVRVAGAAMACLENSGGDVDVLERDADRILDITTELDGHPDNVAASLHGGIVAVAHGTVVRVQRPFEAALVIWVPEQATRTDQSRGRLPSSVAFADAVFNIGRTAVLVAALSSGDLRALRLGTQDRLHQDARLLDRADSRDALEAGLESDALCGWLSGSGPSVAFLAEPGAAHELAGRLPSSGRAHVLEIDERGAHVIDSVIDSVIDVVE